MHTVRNVGFILEGETDEAYYQIEAILEPISARRNELQLRTIDVINVGSSAESGTITKVLEPCMSLSAEPPGTLTSTGQNQLEPLELLEPSSIRTKENAATTTDTQIGFLPVAMAVLMTACISFSVGSFVENFKQSSNNGSAGLCN